MTGRPHCLTFLVLTAVAPFLSATAEPFVAAYVHLNRTFDTNDPIKTREADIVREIERAQAMGIRILMPYTSTSSGKAAYPSNVLPDRLYGDWDPVAFMVAEARERGMDIYPSVPVLVCGHDEPEGILQHHPEWAIRDGDGRPLGFISPGHPNARQFVIAMLKELVERYEVNGILLDYLRYPNKVIRLDEGSEERFLAQTGVESINIADRSDTPWQRFREDQLTTLMAEIHEALPDTTLAIYTWGPHVVSGHNVGQDWASWVRDGYLDIVNVSGYCYPDNYGNDYMDVFRNRLSDAKALLDAAGNRAEATFCLGVVTSHGRVERAAQIKDYLEAARDTGMQGVAVFTMATLDAYYEEMVQQGYIQRFVKPHNRD